METAPSRLSWKELKRSTWLRPVITGCLVAALSYLTARLGLKLVVHPFNMSALWPVNALLLGVLFLVPRKNWPVLITVALAAAVVSDVQDGQALSMIAWFCIGNLVEVLIAAWVVSHMLDGVLTLNSIQGLTKYLIFVVILAPFTSAFLGANVAVRGSYWTEWGLWFFSGSLAFLVVTPAVVALFNLGREALRKSFGYCLEAGVLLAGLVVFGYLTLVASGENSPPALLYSLLPFLLWPALRFGSSGVSISMIVLTFLSIWGAAHDRGPFAEMGMLNNVLSLQMFLTFAATPFMCLAALVEERKRVEEELRNGEKRLRLALAAGKLGVWEWDIKSGRSPWFGSAQALVGLTSTGRSGVVQDFWTRVHPEDQSPLRRAIETAKENHEECEREFRVIWPDGTLHWLHSRGEFFYGAQGEAERMLGVSMDITERKSADQALRRSEAELREAQRLANVGSWYWNPEIDEVIWSEELYRIAGREPNLPAIPYKEHPTLYSAESWERLRNAVEEALQAGTAFELDLEMIRPDGTSRWTIGRGEALRDATGRVVQLRGTVQDITERRQAEKTLRESEERFRLAAQAGKMFAYEWDATTDVLVRSAQSTHVLGIDETTPITGQQILAKVYPDDQQRLLSAIGRLSPARPHLEISYRMIRPDGAVIWVQRNSRAHFDEEEKMLRIVGMVSDITERKRTEEALRESEAWLGMAVQAGRMYAFEWDSASDMIVRTGECENIFNWMDDPMHVSGREFIDGIHPDDREAYEALLDGLAPERPIYQTSFRVLRPDGSVVWLEANGRASFDDQGRRLRIIGMVADVTARKLAEAALSSVSRRLIEAQDQERTRIARELHDDLSQQMALLQIGLEQFENDATEISSQDRQQLHKIAAVALEISSNIRDLSHRLHPTKLDTLGLLPSLSSFCKEIGRQHNLQVHFVHQGVPGPIPREVSLCLFRIVQEALRNVVKHSGATEAKVELVLPGDRIDLCISDFGMGFSLESAKTNGGLGLVSMRERLRLVGGSLSIESEPSRGTRIRASVPLFTTDGVANTKKAREARA